MNYADIIEFWKKQNITTENELSIVLNSYCIDFAYHSGKIENDKITYYDTREIFNKNGVTSYTGDLRTLYEIKNSKDAYEEILKAFGAKQIIDEAFLKRIHKLLTKNTYDTRRYQLGERPGEYKLHDYVTSREEVGALPEDVHEEMSELLSELIDIEEKHALTAAAYFHAKFENIHPFADGNGRTGRLLMNYFLLIHNHPPIVIHEENRNEYYAALEQYDKGLNISALVTFFKKELELTWAKSITKKVEKQKSACSLKDFLTGANDTSSQNSKKEIAHNHDDLHSHDER